MDDESMDDESRCDRPIKEDLIPFRKASDFRLLGHPGYCNSFIDSNRIFDFVAEGQGHKSVHTFRGSSSYKNGQTPTYRSQYLAGKRALEKKV